MEIGRGSHGVIKTVENEPDVIVKCIQAINKDEPFDTYFRIDAVIEPSAIRRLNCCACPYIVELHRCEVLPTDAVVKLYLQKLRPIHDNTLIVSESKLRQTVAQLVSGVASMHACNIYHRDLKTANVMQTSDGDVRIIDFSLALIDAELVTRQCEDMYTINYRAPEILLGQPHYDREKAEAWALGVTCAEILWGCCSRVLFRGVTWYHVVSGIIEAFHNEDVQSFFAQYPKWREFINKSLMRDGYWGYPDYSLHSMFSYLCNRDAADFLCCACKLHPLRRWSAKMLLRHPFIREQPCCIKALEAIENQQSGSILGLPNRMSITQPPTYRFKTLLGGLGDLNSPEGVCRRAMAEALLRFLGVDLEIEGPAAYESALVITGALYPEQAWYFRAPPLMQMLAMPGIFDFFSRQLFVIIKDC